MHDLDHRLKQVANSLPWYERAISAVAPTYGNQRLTARLQRALFAYEGARADRLYAPRTNGQPSESYQTARDRVVMMWQALELVENFPQAKAIVSKFATFLTPNEYAPATGDRDYDAMLAEYFHDWCKRADYTGRHSFKKLIQLGAEMRPAYGDCGYALRRIDSELKVELIGGNRIGNPSEAPGQFPLYMSGVVINQRGAPTAYRVFRVDQAGQYIEPEDVPAASFFHYFDPFRADQYRGVTDFHAVLRTATMLKEILAAEMVGVKFASQQAALVFTERGQAPNRNLFTPGGAPNLPNGEQPKQEYSEIGTFRYLYNGDRVEVMPSRPSSAFSGFVDALEAQIALGVAGYPRGILFGTTDYKGPSVRAEFAQADRVNARHQGLLSDQVLEPIAHAVILDAIASNAIKPPKKRTGETAEQAIVRATRGTFRFPSRLTIDVGRESQARLSELSMGVMTPQEIAAEDGRDAYQRATEKADFAAFVAGLAKERGIPESSIFLPAGSTLPSTPAQAAAVGHQTGDDAAQAEATKSGRGPGQGQPAQPPAEDSRPPTETAREAMQRHARRRQAFRAAIGKSIDTSAGVRRALGRESPSVERITTGLDRFAGKLPELPRNDREAAPQHIVNVGSPVVNMPAPVVNFSAPAQPAPTVHVAGSVVNMPAPVVQFNAPEQPAPVVNVASPSINVSAPVIHMEAAAPIVVPAPVVNVMVPPLNAQIAIQRDGRGKISSADITDK